MRSAVLLAAASLLIIGGVAGHRWYASRHDRDLELRAPTGLLIVMSANPAEGCRFYSSDGYGHFVDRATGEIVAERLHP